jgi:Mor family transcriptional regulator
MKYRNASEILPDPLLRELQKYPGGETLYVPAAGERRAWGEGSGTRRYYAERNEEIRQKYRRGVKADSLAEEYGLSEERVRKIIYG